MQTISKVPGFFMFDCLIGIAILLVMSTIVAQLWGTLLRTHRATVDTAHSLTQLVSHIEQGNKDSQDLVSRQKIAVDAVFHGLPKLANSFNLTQFNYKQCALIAHTDIV